jgi:hypothetical protein
LIGGKKPEVVKMTKDEIEKDRIRQVRLARLGQSTSSQPSGNDVNMSPMKEAIVEKVEKTKAMIQLDNQIAEKKAEEIRKEVEEKKNLDALKVKEARINKDLDERKQKEVEKVNEQKERNRDPKVAEHLQGNLELIYLYSFDNS